MDNDSFVGLKPYIVANRVPALPSAALTVKGLKGEESYHGTLQTERCRIIPGKKSGEGDGDKKRTLLSDSPAYALPLALTPEM